LVLLSLVLLSLVTSRCPCEPGRTESPGGLQRARAARPRQKPGSHGRRCCWVGSPKDPQRQV